MLRYMLQISILLVAGLAGCSTLASDLWGSHYGIGKGSKVILHVPLTIDARDHQAFIQGGEVKKEKTAAYNSSYNEYYPFCYFEIRSPSNQPETISPGEFEITRVTADETEIVQSKPVRVASLFHFDLAGTPSQIVETVIMELRSDAQPNVEQLVCADGFADPGQVVMPTLKQIRDTLGSVATLELVH